LPIASEEPSRAAAIQQATSPSGSGFALSDGKSTSPAPRDTNGRPTGRAGRDPVSHYRPSRRPVNQISPYVATTCARFGRALGQCERGRPTIDAETVRIEPRHAELGVSGSGTVRVLGANGVGPGNFLAAFAAPHDEDSCHASLLCSPKLRRPNRRPSK
jgi:hypothetical protein